MISVMAQYVQILNNCFLDIRQNTKAAENFLFGSHGDIIDLNPSRLVREKISGYRHEREKTIHQ